MGVVEIQNVLYPIYKTLVEVLLTKGAYPTYVDSWKADEKESFRCYRQDVGDTLVSHSCVSFWQHSSRVSSSVLYYALYFYIFYILLLCSAKIFH